MNADLLARIAPAAPESTTSRLLPHLEATMEKYEINTPLRQAHFIAQILHESGSFRYREEIASGAAYEGRKDLGNTKKGDGKRFKGRGLIQLTGRANYEAYGKSLGRESEILSNPKLVAEEDELNVDVAGWFWDRAKLNALADKDDLKAITRRINGGYTGLADRKAFLERAKKELLV